MQKAAFALEQVFYPETTVKANIEFKRNHDEPASEPVVSITIPQQISLEDDKPVLQVVLAVEVPAASPSDPYEIAILTVGRFKSSQQLSTQEFVQAVVFSGPNMLYSATREHILSITSRSAWGEYNLPAIIFGPEDFRMPESE